MLKISPWKNKFIYYLVDAKLNSLNKAGHALSQPLSLQSRESSQNLFLVKSLPMFRNRNERNINLSCPRLSTSNRFAFREGGEKQANLITSNFLVDWHVKNGN